MAVIASLFAFWSATAWADDLLVLQDGRSVYTPFSSGVFWNVLGTMMDKVDHPAIVREINSAADVKGCHIIFVAAEGRPSPPDFLQALHSPDILTVTENAEHFAGSDFVINFVRVGNKVRFAINPQSTAKAGLKISSKLLELAKPMEK